jgi:hypothetical protein
MERGSGRLVGTPSLTGLGKVCPSTDRNPIPAIRVASAIAISLTRQNKVTSRVVG